MNDELRSLLPSAVVLGAFAGVAVFLTVTRGWAAGSAAHIRGAVNVTLLTISFQTMHFAEELLTGFRERFPALFDLPPMPLRFFVLFNLAWILVWSLCAWGLAARRRAALFPLWFLGIACIANGVAHPALSVLAGGYFPGLVTSPLVGVLGVLLLRRLARITHRGELLPGAA
jgi:Protein of unknown function with HXXEE motif